MIPFSLLVLNKFTERSLMNSDPESEMRGYRVKGSGHNLVEQRDSRAEDSKLRSMESRRFDQEKDRHGQGQRDKSS
jgi:hypothetical protein